MLSKILRPKYRDVPVQQREPFFNWRKGDKVRLVPGGVVRNEDARIVDSVDKQTGHVKYKIYTIKSANPFNNTCKLEEVQVRVPLPPDPSPSSPRSDRVLRRSRLATCAFP